MSAGDKHVAAKRQELDALERGELVDLTARLALEARELADEAAKAVTEPRRFWKNEDGQQQVLAVAVARTRTLLRRYSL